MGEAKKRPGRKGKCVRIELRTTKRWQSVPREIKNKFVLHTDHGRYYAANVPAKEERTWKIKARSYKMKFISYDAGYIRSTYYRTKFLRYKGSRSKRYRCVYCGRRVKESSMVVDHVISIKAAQSSAYARFLLRNKTGIDDISNLVPSCPRCNNRKGDSISLFWRLRAKLGEKEAYWVIRRMLFLCAVSALMYFLITNEGFHSCMDRVVHTAAGQRLMHLVMDFWTEAFLPFTVKVRSCLPGRPCSAYGAILRTGG